jgi:GTP-binding protein EngB required for normal cell division
VVTVDPPCAAEQEFLKDIREYVHKLFLVLNKIDYVEAADRQEALEFTTQCTGQPGNQQVAFPFLPSWPWTQI